MNNLKDVFGNKLVSNNGDLELITHSTQITNNKDNNQKIEPLLYNLKLKVIDFINKYIPKII